MNVGELKKIIADMPDKTIVVLSRDSEGNGYSECQDWSADHKYKQGEIGLRKLTPAHRASGYSEDDVLSGGKLALVLWP